VTADCCEATTILCLRAYPDKLTLVLQSCAIASARSLEIGLAPL